MVSKQNSLENKDKTNVFMISSLPEHSAELKKKIVTRLDFVLG